MTLVVKCVVRATLLVAGLCALGAPALANDPGRIDAYVTPYYNSSGPVVRIGTYSAGLASKTSATVVATILQMKQRWNQLNFLELYVFGDIDSLTRVSHRVLGENRAVQNVTAIYPGVAFIDKAQWQRTNAQLNAGLGQLASSLSDRKAAIARERAQNGTAARFSHLTSKPFP